MQEKWNHQHEKPQTERQYSCCPVAVAVPFPIPVSSTVQPSTSTKWESKNYLKGYYLQKNDHKNKKPTKNKKWKDTSLKNIKKSQKDIKKI